LDEIEKERKALSAKRDDHNVKLEKEGEVWLVRFLPAFLGVGERKRFFAPIAQHWVNKRPHFCARVTPPECGGDPDSHCALCDLSEDIRSSYENSNRDISTLGYKASASKQWLTYSLVWSKEAKGQEPWVAEGDEQWQPYRFWLNKTNFDDLLEYYKRFLQKRPDNRFSILDPEIGVDFIVKRANNKITLQKDEARSIYPEGYTKEDKENLLTYILDKIKMPTYRPLGSEEMDAACAKLEESVRKLESAPSRPRSSRPSVDEDEDAPRRAPAPAPRPAPRPSAPARPAPRHEAEAYEPEPPRPAPRPAPRQAAPAPARPAPRPLPSAAPRSVPSARPPAQEIIDADEIPFEFQDSQPEAPDEAPAPAPTPSSRLRQAGRQVEPEAPTRSRVESSVDDDDNVTDEQRDPVGAADVGEMEDAPPAPVEKVQTRPASRMSEKLRSAISRTQQ
jgi:hypothetical protein